MITRASATARPARRRGITLVECALLLSVFLMFLFGVFEYARYLLTLHVATNAARDGARYAVTNVRQAGDFDVNTPTPAQYDSEGNQLIAIETYTQQRMGGVDKQISGLTIDVFPCDSTQIYQDPPVITPKAGWGPNPSTRTTNWNSAVFTERIAVRITGTYTPILPNFLWMQNATNIKIVAVMGSEG